MTHNAWWGHGPPFLENNGRNECTFILQLGTVWRLYLRACHSQLGLIWWRPDNHCHGHNCSAVPPIFPISVCDMAMSNIESKGKLHNSEAEISNWFVRGWQRLNIFRNFWLIFFGPPPPLVTPLHVQLLKTSWKKNRIEVVCIFKSAGPCVWAMVAWETRCVMCLKHVDGEAHNGPNYPRPVMARGSTGQI